MAIRTIVALFDDYPEAEGAIRELESAGVPSTAVNLIANNAGNRYGNYPHMFRDYFSGQPDMEFQAFSNILDEKPLPSVNECDAWIIGALSSSLSSQRVLDRS